LTNWADPVCTCGITLVSRLEIERNVGFHWVASLGIKRSCCQQNNCGEQGEQMLLFHNSSSLLQNVASRTFSLVECSTSRNSWRWLLAFGRLFEMLCE